MKLAGKITTFNFCASRELVSALNIGVGCVLPVAHIGVLFNFNIKTWVRYGNRCFSEKIIAIRG